MSKDAGDAVDIMAKVIGGNDTQDPETNSTALLGYLSDFINLIMPHDVKLFENFDYFTFTTIAGQDVYPFDVSPLPVGEFVNYGEPVYIEDTSTLSTLRMRFYQNPAVFFDRWLLDPDAQQQGKPTDILIFDDEITLRTVPDDEYKITMIAYRKRGPLDGLTEEIIQDYTWRYAAYGACLDWFVDHGQVDQAANIMPFYERYRAIVLARTASQRINTVPRPAL